MMVSVLHDIALHLFFVCPLITDSSLQSSENSSHCRNQPSANHPQVLGDEQSAKFTVLFPRAGRQIEDGIKKNIGEERIKNVIAAGFAVPCLFSFIQGLSQSSTSWSVLSSFVDRKLNPSTYICTRQAI